MRVKALALSFALTLACSAAAIAAEPPSATPHLRPLNAAGAALMADAQQKSATIRDLAAQLEGSNVVAYIYPTARQVGETESDFRYVGTSKSQRFVLIKIGADRSADRQIELLGHELEHAVEVARATWVNDSSDLDRFLSLVGSRTFEPGGHPFETPAAMKAERTVRKELPTAIGTR